MFAIAFRMTLEGTGIGWSVHSADLDAGRRAWLQEWEFGLCLLLKRLEAVKGLNTLQVRHALDENLPNGF